MKHLAVARGFTQFGESQQHLNPPNKQQYPSITRNRITLELENELRMNLSHVLPFVLDSEPADGGLFHVFFPIQRTGMHGIAWLFSYPISQRLEERKQRVGGTHTPRPCIHHLDQALLLSTKGSLDTVIPLNRIEIQELCWIHSGAVSFCQENQHG